MFHFEEEIVDDRTKGAGILALCIDTGNLLVGYRPEGKYSSIGGYLKYGEKFWETAAREFTEETGYDGPISLLRGFHYHNPVKNFEYVNFLGIVPTEFEPILDDSHTDICWVSLSEIFGGRMDFLPEFEDFLFESKPMIDNLLCTFGILNP